MATRRTQPECAIESRHVSQLFGCAIQGRGSRGDEKAFCANSSTNKNAHFVSFVQKSVSIFFKFLTQQSPVFKFVQCGNGGLSKAHIASHGSPIPLVYVIISMVTNYAPSVPILSQFLSGSMSVNLAFQLSGKTFKSSYIGPKMSTSPY